VGVVSQADIALEAKDKSVGEMVAEISKPPQGRGSRSYAAAFRSSSKMVAWQTPCADDDAVTVVRICWL